MGSASRSTEYLNAFKVLKKCYQPVSPLDDRTVLEHLLFACCLEDAHYEAAEEAYAAAVHTFFDFNEMRVTTIAELSEVMANLPDPPAASNRLKRVLQSIFEESYSFDLEAHRKKNLGPTVNWLRKIDGTTSFTVSYVVQSALDGHSIPIDSGALNVFRILGLISEKEYAGGVAPGLERAIAKAKGIELGSLLHQFGADFTANPYSPAVHKTLLQISPDAKERLPKRRAAKQKKAEAEKPSRKKADKSKPPEKGKQKKAGTKAKTSGRKTTSGSASGLSDKKAAAERTPAKPAKNRKKTASEGLSKRKPR
jgi:hypothetical protein